MDTMTGPEHVREALRLSALAEQEVWSDGDGVTRPTDAQRERMMMRAILHAQLARTAAMVDTTTWGSSNGPVTYRDRATEKEWHTQFRGRCAEG